jgi:protein ImuA
MPALLQHIVNAATPRGHATARAFDMGQLPGAVVQAIWHGSDLGQTDQRVVPTGFAGLDAHLPGGGWPCNAVT